MLKNYKSFELLEQYLSYLTVIKGRSINTVIEYRTDVLMFFEFLCIFRLHPATCTVFFCHLAEQNPPPCRGCLPLHRWCKGSARSLRSGKALASKVQLVNQSS